MTDTITVQYYYFMGMVVVGSMLGTTITLLGIVWWERYSNKENDEPTWESINKVNERTIESQSQTIKALQSLCNRWEKMLDETEK